jgi:hypothetical protein
MEKPKKKIVRKPVKKKEPVAVKAKEEEKPVEVIEPAIVVEPDKSGLDEEGKIMSLTNLLQCLPPQYVTEEKIRDTVFALARFIPTEAQLEKARAGAPQRFPQ